MNNFESTFSASSTDPLPPRMFIVGNLHDGHKSVVKIENITYEFEDPFMAFETLFKIHHALNSSYPAQSNVVWTFIERFVYKIDSNNISNTQLITILNEMNNFVNNNC